MNIGGYPAWEVIEACVIILWHLIKWSVIIGFVIWAGVILLYLVVFIAGLYILNAVLCAK
ncbi:hypothetical protein [Colwellia sp. MEBiC06753]